MDQSKSSLSVIGQWQGVVRFYFLYACTRASVMDIYTHKSTQKHTHVHNTHIIYKWVHGVTTVFNHLMSAGKSHLWYQHFDRRTKYWVHNAHLEELLFKTLFRIDDNNIHSWWNYHGCADLTFVWFLQWCRTTQLRTLKKISKTCGCSFTR